jgi:cytochrome c oxidase cbb3-type subunit III
MSHSGTPPKGEEQNIVFESEKSILLDHNYDGIQELDHPLPGWWLVTFYLTIIFSAIYIGYYHVAGGPLQNQELETDLAEIKSRAPAPASSEDLAAKAIAMKDDSAALAAGKTAYIAKCAACHGNLGEGGIGPNLTDKFWIHGSGDAASVIKVIVDGVPEKGMPTWGPIIPPEETAQLTAFIATLSGTTPPNAKGPEGKEIQ